MDRIIQSLYLRNSVFTPDRARQAFFYRSLNQVRADALILSNRKQRGEKLSASSENWLKVTCDQFETLTARSSPPKRFYRHGDDALSRMTATAASALLVCGSMIRFCRNSVSIAAANVLLSGFFLGATGIILFIFRGRNKVCKKSLLQPTDSKISAHEGKNNDRSLSAPRGSHVAKSSGAQAISLPEASHSTRFFRSQVRVQTLDKTLVTKDLVGERAAIFTLWQGRHNDEGMIRGRDHRPQNFIFDAGKKDLIEQCCISVDSLATLQDSNQIQAALEHAWSFDWFNKFLSASDKKATDFQFLLHGAFALTLRDKVYFLVQGSCNIWSLDNGIKSIIHRGGLQTGETCADEDFESSDAMLVGRGERLNKAKPVIFYIERNELQGKSLLFSSNRTEKSFSFPISLNHTDDSLKKRSFDSPSQMLDYDLDSSSKEELLLLLEPSFFWPSNDTMSSASSLSMNFNPAADRNPGAADPILPGPANPNLSTTETATSQK